jgi:MFS family permease
MTLMGLVKDFRSLLVVRMALGLAEGGLFPGVTWYITLWYRRHECGLRMAIFFSAATLAGAFGGLLARGISQMKGVGGRPGWAWIFILEGLATIIVAAFAKLLINDSPETYVELLCGTRLSLAHPK